ncbi:MAG: NAD-dependent epimerase/dehydratase family protein [Candidatus Aminicenantes bacterium]|nr:NAD-dependent epimerase/dehydratase family protein [Candidatus Aminicenantes bacterium]
MKALVFGGNGFIGSHLVERLAGAGHVVRVYDQVCRKSTAAGAVEQITEAFGAVSPMRRALAGVDVVYHLVSSTMPGTSLDPTADIEANLIGTVHLLELMKEMPTKRIVFISSGGTVYGEPEHVPILEDHPLLPLCSYGVVKVAIEHYLRLYRRLHGLSPTILRPANAYGPNQSHIGVQGLISTVLRKIKDGTAVTIWGDGSAVRDYIHVCDLVDLCLLAGESDQCGPFNVGSGQGHSVCRVLDIIREVVGTVPDIHFAPGRPLDVSRNILDVTRVRAAFGWKAAISLPEGIRALWQWMNEQPNGLESGGRS